MRPRLVVAAAAGVYAAMACAGCSGPEAAPASAHSSATVDADHTGVGRPGPSGGVRAHQPAPRVVTLAFAGDTHFQLNLSTLLDHPRGALGPVAGLLAHADLTMLNLESAISSDGTWDSKELEDPAERYWYRTPGRALDVLADAGVDLVSVANNHGADAGPEGLVDTLRAQAHGPIPVLGVGRNRAAAFTAYRTTVHRTRLAFLAADTSTREGSSSIWAAGPRSPGLAAAGADVIVGSSSHLQQGSGWLGDTYVDYGLGNFLWYHNHDPDTGVLRVRVVDGHPTSDRWLPGHIPVIGPPVPVHGQTKLLAVARWRALRGCTGLAARPASAPPLPAYTSKIRRVSPLMRTRMASSHGRGCPTPWSELRMVSVAYVGFDGRAHRGRLIIAARHARDVAQVFSRLYEARWPVRRMRPVSDYGGDDERSMAADNTSGFNCRTVAGSDQWSAHAYGTALDLNPVENPDLHDGSVRPTAGRANAHLDRTAGATVPPGAVRADDVVVRAFREVGWEWGGTWSSPDYQHFAARGT